MKTLQTIQLILSIIFLLVMGIFTILKDTNLIIVMGVLSLWNLISANNKTKMFGKKLK